MEYFSDFDTKFDSQDLLNLSKEAVSLVLRSDRISVRSENTIWHALKYWVGLGKISFSF